MTKHPRFSATGTPRSNQIPNNSHEPASGAQAGVDGNDSGHYLLLSAGLAGHSLLDSLPGTNHALGDDPETTLRTEFFDASLMARHMERFAILLACEDHLASLRFDPITVAQICAREAVPPPMPPDDDENGPREIRDEAARRRLFTCLLDGVTLRKTRRTLDHAYRVSQRRLERSIRASQRNKAQNSRNPGRRCRGRPPAALPKNARWSDPDEARTDLLAVAAAIIHLEAHHHFGLSPSHSPLWQLVLAESCKITARSESWREDELGLTTGLRPAKQTDNSKPTANADDQHLKDVEDEVVDTLALGQRDPALLLAPAIASMVRGVLRPTLSLDHLLSLVIQSARKRPGGEEGATQDQDKREDDNLTSNENEAASKALQACFTRDEARSRRRGDVRRLRAALLGLNALKALPASDNPFFQAARRSALLDLRASAALGNVPNEVAKVLASPLDPSAHLAFAARLRELGASERASRVETQVKRAFGIDVGARLGEAIRVAAAQRQRPQQSTAG